MSFRTKHLPLTEDQKERGVIFSSALVVTNANVETVTHEVFNGDFSYMEKIERLKDVRFFKSLAKDLHYNVIHEIRGYF